MQLFRTGRLSLNHRLFLVMAISLLPVSILIVVQGTSSRTYLQGLTGDRLMANAEAAAAEHRNMLYATNTKLRQASMDPDVLNANAQCEGKFFETIQSQPKILNMFRVDAAGNVLCSAIRAAHDVNYAMQPWWNDATTARSLILAGGIIDPVVQSETINVIWPLLQDGRFSGAIIAPVSTSYFDHMAVIDQKKVKSATLIIDSTGRILLQSPRSRFASAPAQPALGSIREMTDRQGKHWMYTVSPLFGHELYILYAEPKALLMGQSDELWVQMLLLPVAILVFTALGLWWGVHNLVLRWLQKLSDKAARIATGTYVYHPDSFVGAPSEIGHFANSLRKMATDIDAQKHDLKASAAHSEAMAREINHQVKNNLQIILSLLHMQRARTQNDEVKTTLSQTLSRMGAVAATQRLTYERGDLSAGGYVDMDSLLAKIVQQIKGAFPDSQSRINSSCSIGMLPMAKALPVALIVVETVTNALVHAFGSSAGSIRIMLDKDGELATLQVVDDGSGFETGQKRPGMGLALIEALVQQLDGDLQLTTAPDAGTRVEVRFKIDSR